MCFEPLDNPVVRLWDELSDFDAARADDACRHLMASLANLVKARNVGWIGSMRTADAPVDPLLGWRVATTAYLIEEPLNSAAVADMKALWAKGHADPLTIKSLEGAGQRFRAFTLRQVMPAEWFDSPYYTVFYQGRRIHDAMIVGFPLNEDAESDFILHAAPERGAFEPHDLDLVTRTLRGIKWFHRRLMLNHGLVIASAPLTPAERKVLSELLTDASEKEVAARLDLAPSTVHQYAVSIYRKFGTKGRAGLMSLWLNRS